MFRVSAAMKISLGLMLVTVSVLLATQYLGLLPDRAAMVRENRNRFCELVAVQCSVAAQKNDIASLRTILRVAVQRNDNIVSAGVRGVNGTPLAVAGNHPEDWWAISEQDRDTLFARVPLMKDDKPWANFELQYVPAPEEGMFGQFTGPFVKLILVIGLGGFVGYLLLMKRTLEYLNPSSAVPERVRSAFDILAEGLIIVDQEQRIVLANGSFAEHVGRTPESLIGKKPSDMDWDIISDDAAASEAMPWSLAALRGQPQTGAQLSMVDSDGKRCVFSVNAAPITGEDGRNRGVLATFDDVTEIEEKNQQLRNMLSMLKNSRDEVAQQNEHLQFLAKHDPLTGCMNRRSFFERFEVEWDAAKRYGKSFACVMVDVDHFKKINDTYGHALGDVVLQKVAAVLQKNIRQSDLLCRYGGEEFCLLLPYSDPESATEAAERFRRRIAEHDFSGVHVTASMGVSSMTEDVENPQEMLNRADKCLYVAKRNGRNQVVRWDRVSAEDLEGATTTPEQEDDIAASGSSATGIPVHAVEALMSALAHRDITTAEHSNQVAEFAVACAQGIMSPSDCFVLETAGRLHDIGKLGVPDAILLKPGKLTDEEWEVMRGHDRMGVEIIASAFDSDSLARIVRSHHAWYGGNPNEPGLPTGEDIPVPARILSIADAFSAMVSDRPYRRAMPYEEAYQELRRCAGTQFDPDLVERFIECMEGRDHSRRKKAEGVTGGVLLEIGREIDQIADALDAQDLAEVSSTAGRLAAVATKQNLPRIAQRAAELNRAAQSSDVELLRVVQLTTDLLNLCRQAREDAGNEEPQPEKPQNSAGNGPARQPEHALQ